MAVAGHQHRRPPARSLQRQRHAGVARALRGTHGRQAGGRQVAAVAGHHLGVERGLRLVGQGSGFERLAQLERPGGRTFARDLAHQRQRSVAAEHRQPGREHRREQGLVQRPAPGLGVEAGGDELPAHIGPGGYAGSARQVLGDHHRARPELGDQGPAALVVVRVVVLLTEQHMVGRLQRRQQLGPGHLVTAGDLDDAVGWIAKMGTGAGQGACSHGGQPAASAQGRCRRGRML